MDLNAVETYRIARTRDDLTLTPGEILLGGGTWIFSDPNADVSGLVDLAGMDWPSIEATSDGGMRIAATATIAEVSALQHDHRWRCRALFGQCAEALLASFKIWNTATFGGNICRSYAAAGMVSLCVGLDGIAQVWRADGSDYHLPVERMITGNGTNTLSAGDVLRTVEFPEGALRARTAYRKIALSELGRSGAVLTGRQDEDGATVFGITASTLRPVTLRYEAIPSAATLRNDVLVVEDYYTDPLGVADWRRAVTAVLLEEIRQELMR